MRWYTILLEMHLLLYDHRNVVVEFEYLSQNLSLVI